jgi:protein SHQ1
VTYVVLVGTPKDVYLNLPPLLFAVLYDQITTLSSPTPESPWTISRMTPQLSSLSPLYLPSSPAIPFSQHPALKQIKISLLRRVLSYPLYRSFPLAEKIWTSVSDVIILGRRAILRILLKAREILMDGDWSVFVRIWFEDYIIWCQTCHESVLKVLGEEMKKVTIETIEIGYPLEDGT